MITPVLCLLLLARAPQTIPEGPARTGWEAIQRGDGDKAAVSFRQVLADNPRDPGALAGSAIASHLLGRDDQAIASLKRALEIKPDFAYAAFLLGQYAYAQGDLDLAITSYERGLKIAPGSAELYKQLEAWKKEAELHAGFTSRPGVRFNILFEGPEQQAIATRVSNVLEAAYARVGGSLGVYPPETITAILYSREQFHDVTKSPTWAAGAYDGRIRIPVLGSLRTPGELDRVVTHEYVHAALQSLAPRGLPLWLNEGLATYFEPVDHGWLEQRLRTAKTTIPMSDLEQSFGRLDGADALLAYAQGFTAARLLAQRLGGNFPVFLQYVGNGTSLDQALLLFNITDADVQREWQGRTK
jgi:tetratricopeptide repeat protein